jgi:hypothetical protein
MMDDNYLGHLSQYNSNPPRNQQSNGIITLLLRQTPGRRVTAPSEDNTVV